MVCQRLVLLMSKSRPKRRRWAAIYKCRDASQAVCSSKPSQIFLAFTWSCLSQKKFIHLPFFSVCNIQVRQNAKLKKPMPVQQGFQNLKFLLQFIRQYNEAGDTITVRESKNFGKIRKSSEVKLTCIHTYTRPVPAFFKYILFRVCS